MLIVFVKNAQIAQYHCLESHCATILNYDCTQHKGRRESKEEARTFSYHVKSVHTQKKKS